MPSIITTDTRISWITPRCAPFPAPDPHARAAAQIVVRSLAGGDDKVIFDRDLRPSLLAWIADRGTVAFVADSDWRDELKYERTDLWTVSTTGTVMRLTDDPYVHSDMGFSPDGRYLSYIRTHGTDLVIQQKLSHGGPTDLFMRPLTGGEPVNLTADWDLEPEDPQWSPDGRFITSQLILVARSTCFECRSRRDTSSRSRKDHAALRT